MEKDNNYEGEEEEEEEGRARAKARAEDAERMYGCLHPGRVLLYIFLYHIVDYFRPT